MTTTTDQGDPDDLLFTPIDAGCRRRCCCCCRRHFHIPEPTIGTYSVGHGCPQQRLMPPGRHLQRCAELRPYVFEVDVEMAYNDGRSGFERSELQGGKGTMVQSQWRCRCLGLQATKSDERLLLLRPADRADAHTPTCSEKDGGCQHVSSIVRTYLCLRE